MKILIEKNYLRYEDLNLSSKFKDGDFIYTVKHIFPENDGSCSIVLSVKGEELTLHLDKDQLSDIAGEEIK